MEIPVSVITDVDVREYEKNSALDENGAPKKDNKGKLIYDFLKRDIKGVTQETSSKIAKLKTDYNSQKVSAFIAPRWTLEYCIFKSSSLSSLFKEVVKVVHSGTDWDSDFEKALAEKLINKSLDKTEIAYQIAQRLEDDLKLKKEDQKITINSEDEKETLNYLIKAIKYAAGKNTSN
jgi:putative ATP-dependent endonuclease of OLD family